MGMSFPKYEAYKDSGVEWLGEVPEHWDLMPFFSRFKERNEKNTGLKENNLLSLSYGRIIQKDINTLEGLLPESFETYQIVNPDDLIFRLTDLQNDKRSLRSAIVLQKGIITSAYLAVENVNIDPSFANHLFRAYDLLKVFYSMGGGLRQSMKYSDMKWLPVLTPPLSEQAQIARFLEHETAWIDALIAEQERLIELLKEKRQAVISHAVTKGLDRTAPMKDSGVEWLGEVPAHWELMQFKFATTLMQTGPFGSQLHAEDYVENGTPLINPAHIVEGQIVPDSNISVDEKTKERLPRHHLKENDLILARRGELGRCAVVRQQHSGWLCGSGSMRVELSEKLMPDYAYLLISSEGVKAELSVTSKGSTMDNLNPEILGRLRLPIPPKAEQGMILEQVKMASEQYDGLTSLACRQVEILQERRSALISAAVTGKIDVRGWQPPASAAPAATLEAARG